MRRLPQRDCVVMSAADEPPRDHAEVALVLEEARALVTGDRAVEHGDVFTNFAGIAGLWNAYLEARAASKRCAPTPPLTRHDVAILMSLLKVARTLTGNHNRDDYVDAAAYLSIADFVRRYTE